MSHRGASSAPNRCWAFFLRREYGPSRGILARTMLGVASYQLRRAMMATPRALLSAGNALSGVVLRFCNNRSGPRILGPAPLAWATFFQPPSCFPPQLLAAPRLHGVFATAVARLFPGRTSFLEQIPNQMHGWPPPIVAKRWRRRVNLNVGGSPSLNPFSRVQT
jgi:hypothetical protein